MAQIMNFDRETLIHALELKLWLFEVYIGSAFRTNKDLLSHCEMVHHEKLGMHAITIGFKNAQ